MNKAMDEKLNLYYRAKEAYYAGTPIMEDFEFDELEKELGLENKSYVGTKHNAAYTVPHPFIMGSLSKVQIHEKNGVIDWNEYYTKVSSYINKYCSDPENNLIIVTPKYDGCSFEIVAENGKIKSISTRGDGEYGKDIFDQIHTQCEDAIKNVTLTEKIVYRGEVLIDKNIFASKYSEFVNPRSFVAGILGRKFDGLPKDELDKLIEMCKDLSIVIYDVRVFKDNEWEDCDFVEFNPKFYVGYGQIGEKYLPSHFIYEDTFESVQDLTEIYNIFSEYRTICEYALDGIVIKPVAEYRKNNLTEERPKDCVAIKFIPMLEETEIVDIEWNIGKTGEYVPTIITNPVIMDGKEVKRASGSNYGNLIKKKLSIGSKVILSLAGDIIPFVYKVTNTEQFDENNLNLPDNTYVEDCHLMANLTEEEKAKINFMASAEVLNVENLGPAVAEVIFESFKKTNDETDDFFGDDNSEVELPINLLMVSAEDVYFAIVNSSKNGATGKATKVSKAFKEMVSTISLAKVIQSCNFRFCGETVSEQCANYLMGLPYDFTHLASEGYEWVMNENSNELATVNFIINYMGKIFEDFKPSVEMIAAAEKTTSNAIPVILTGDPVNYNSKADFRNQHPEYREVKTTKSGWAECKILFTNSLSSTTAKMKKAKELGIEIKLY